MTTPTEIKIKSCQNEKNSLQILVLFDISQEDFDYFKNQQKRIEKVLRHINLITKESSSNFYGLIAFHRSPVVLNPINSLESSNVDKVIEQIHSLRPRRHLETSPAKALLIGTQLFSENSNNSKNIILLVHNGENTDMVNESIEAMYVLNIKEEIREIGGCFNLINSSKTENKFGEKINNTSENSHSDFECKNGSEVGVFMILNLEGYRGI
uniref:VWFA domain-containing protein n=1 Tax=Meloidogyne javanica TaxID=6303 RepID=A0A915NE97_MELJA